MHKGFALVLSDFSGVIGGSGQNTGVGLMKPGVESLASNAKFIGDITSTSAFNLHEVNSIDLEFFGIKAAGQSHDKTPYRNGYRDLL